jgi:predicted DCC family thiol-disulfide oxidoreductase YuxK
MAAAAEDRDRSEAPEVPPEAPGVQEMPDDIILYDGVCGLCHRSVAFLIKRDHGKALYFAPLQGPTAAALRQEHPEIPTTLETVVYVDHGRVHLRSKAFFHVSRHLTRPWRWAYHLRWLPAFLVDLGYRVVCRVRYRVWGKYDTCQVPSVGDRARLLP